MTSTVVLLELVHITTSCCGITFGAPASTFRRWRENGEQFFCPKCGGGQYFTTSENTRLKNEIERLIRDKQGLRDDAAYERNERQRISRRLIATKGVVTRTKNRISKGICPCCNRYFANLHRHIKSQHPDYSTTDEAANR